MIFRKPMDPTVKRIESLDCIIMNTLIGGNYCPVCDRASSFEEYNGRKSAICTRCNSIERHRLFFSLFSEIFGMEGTVKVLYVGSDLIMIKQLSSRFDTSVVKIDRAADKSEISLDGLKAKSFDLVVIGDILDHVSNVGALLAGIKKLLVKNGYVMAAHVPSEDDVITVPQGSSVAWYQDAIQTYGTETFADLFSADYTADLVPKNVFTEDQVRLYSIKTRYDVIIGKAKGQ